MFNYDGLSRLTSATSPESGTITYSYLTASGALCSGDPTNICRKIAPSPNQVSSGMATITTTYTYDGLDRVTGKSYQDSYAGNPTTAAVKFGYDGVALTGCATTPPTLADSYPSGRRTSICDGSGAASWAHDQMGRIKHESRTIGTVKGDHETDVYNLDGSVANSTALAYSVAYGYNGAGRVKSAKNSADPFNYVTSASYAPSGSLTAASMGAQPITVNNSYNSRLQPSVLSTSTTAATIQSLSFDFHSSSHADNGNVFQIVNNRDNNRTQNFVYDPLNRIQSAYTSGPNWGETYTIDPWGNLTNITRYQSKSQWETMNCASANTRNQLNTCYTYDAAGNTIQNGTATYTYDGENRLIATAGMSYIYDGDGKRVEKCTAGSAPGTCASNATGILYWTGWGNDPLAETDLSGNVLENFVFFNGQRIARRDASTKAVHFYFSDHLGTHSLITDAAGDMPPQKESDYYPYGGEIPVSGSDSNHYKFTGKERDAESGLDNFGARHFASVMGRFMSPDAKSMTYRHVAFPQKWNKYAYVQNNPLVRIDPNGLDDYVVFRTVTSGWNSEQWAAAEKSITSQKDASGNRNTFHMIEGGKATVEAYRDALKTPDTHVVFVGHANEGTPNSKETTGVQLENGVTEKGGGSTTVTVKQGPDPSVAPEMNISSTISDPVAAGNSVALFACDSYNLASDYSGTDFTGVQSSFDGTTLETLDQAAAGFVAAGGGQPGVDAANSAIENSPYPIDTGDNTEEDPD